MDGGPTSYRLDLSQRVYVLVFGGALVLFQILQGDTKFAIVLAALVAVAFSAQGRWRTVVSATHVESAGAAFFNRSVDWESVVGVDEGRQFGARVVRVTLRDGGDVKLRVPVDGPLMRDPEFGEKLQAIRSTWWRAISEPNT